MDHTIKFIEEKKYEGMRDPRGPLGHLGKPMSDKAMETFEEFFGMAVSTIYSAYQNAFAYPQELDHAYIDMKNACEEILDLYKIFLKGEGVEL